MTCCWQYYSATELDVRNDAAKLAETYSYDPNCAVWSQYTIDIVVAGRITPGIAERESEVFSSCAHQVTNSS